MNKKRKDPSAMTASSSKRRRVTIPDDMIFEILIRLPVPPLLRFKSVCTSWCTSIKSSDFISRHLQRSKLENNHDDKLIVFNSSVTRSPYYSFTFNIISVHDLQHYKSVEFMPIVNSDEMSGLTVIASFDGIICFIYRRLDCRYNWVGVVSLWNPATNHITILPSLEPHIQEGDRLYIAYGFGFDVKTNDYKVVSIEVSVKDQTKKSHVEVYSLRMDSWRTINAVVRFSIVSGPRKPFRNDIYFWLGYDWDSRKPLILSFSFSDEAFGKILLPEAPTNGGSKWIVTLAFLSEKLALFAEDGKGCCKIWVMEEYGVNESWTNLYTLDFRPVARPMGFTTDGKIILRKGGLDPLCLYDPVAQEIKDIPFLGVVSDAVVYNETLVSARSANGVTNRESSEDMLSVCTMYPDRMNP